MSGKQGIQSAFQSVAALDRATVDSLTMHVEVSRNLLKQFNQQKLSNSNKYGEQQFNNLAANQQTSRQPWNMYNQPSRAAVEKTVPYIQDAIPSRGSHSAELRGYPITNEFSQSGTSLPLSSGGSTYTSKFSEGDVTGGNRSSRIYHSAHNQLATDAAISSSAYSGQSSPVYHTASSLSLPVRRNELSHFSVDQRDTTLSPLMERIESCNPLENVSILASNSALCSSLAFPQDSLPIF